MSTSALIHVLDGKKKAFVTIYVHWDGYPSGLGVDLRDFIKDRRVGNGISLDGPKSFSNGIEDFAAQLVVFLKSEYPIGNVYLFPPGVSDMCEEYVYTMRAEEEKIILTCVRMCDGHAIAPAKFEKE